MSTAGKAVIIVSILSVVTMGTIYLVKHHLYKEYVDEQDKIKLRSISFEVV